MSSQMTGVELLKLGDQDRKRPFLTEIWPYFLGVTFGICTGVSINFGTRRPLFSGIQKHILATGGWTAILKYASDRRDAYLAEKDAVFRHYIELHPEDFVEPDRKKIADIFEPWIPIR